jgi:hypothetical protein
MNWELFIGLICVGWLIGTGLENAGEKMADAIQNYTNRIDEIDKRNQPKEPAKIPVSELDCFKKDRILT